MHRDSLAFVTITPHTDFLITTSIDGVVKFWKKTLDGIEFVKMWRPHTSAIVSVSVSADGRSYATAAAEGEGGGKVVVWDVVTFDLVATMPLEYVPREVCWVHGRGAGVPVLAVSDAGEAVIRLHDGRGERGVMQEIRGLHRAPVHLMRYNPAYDCVVSADESGMVEYWAPSRPELNFEKPAGLFAYKSDTSLFEFKKSKSVPTTLTFSPTGQQFATFSYPDRIVRVFNFKTGKLHRSYDESLTTLTTLHQASTSASKPSDLEFGRKMALEHNLDAAALRYQNILFDETATFLIYGSMAGIKIINTHTNRLARLLAADENIRPLNVALYQGAPQKKEIVTIEMAASENPLLAAAAERAPMLVSTAVQRSRFYIFDSALEVSKSDRDVLNEKPLATAGKDAPASSNRVSAATASAAILHTSMGDIHLRLFPEVAPKTVENFVTHARNGYYNNTVFHRVVKKFMIQAGDPLGDGTGGESIWGGEFEDEFSGGLRHDKPYTLSSANRGKNTNGSQWFITTEKTVCAFPCGGSGWMLMRVCSRGWMGFIPSLGERRRAWMLCIRSRMCAPGRMINQRRM